MSTSGSLPARIGFAGTPEFAARVLRGLLAVEANVVCVYTQPDRPRGRGRKLAPSPVKQVAIDADIEVRQPRSLRPERNQDALAQLQSTQLDVLVVAAYGLILPQPILDAPRLGCINVHASLLPRWRGAAPIERAIMAGDTQSGVCIMRMEAGLDTGGVYSQRRLPITHTTTGRELHDAMSAPAIEALLETLTEFAPEQWQAQDESRATYAQKLRSTDADIDWHKPAEQVIRQINALNDRLPARTEFADETIKLLRAAPVTQAEAELIQSNTTDTDTTKKAPGTIVATSKKAIAVAAGEQFISIREVQLSRGKGKPMPIAAALNGYPDLFQVGQRFTSAQTSQPNLSDERQSER